MSVNEEERSLRRRIVFQAMNGNATPQAIESAITTLDTEFGDVENIRFNQLIQRLQDTLDNAEANLGRVLGQIMTLRTLPQEQIGPDPRTAGSPPAPARPAREPVPRAAAPRKGLHNVFATLVEAIVGQLRHRNDDSHMTLINAVIKSPEVTKLGARVVGGFQAWSESPDAGALQVNATEDEYRVVVHVIYVWLCQKLGPVDADRLLNAAVRTADQLPDAVNNSPKALL